MLNICRTNRTTLNILRFVPRKSQSNYIEVFEGNQGACWSRVGRVGGKQQVSLGKGCAGVGIVVHEFMHALGKHYNPSHDDVIKIYFEQTKQYSPKIFSFFFNKLGFLFFRLLARAVPARS